MWGKVLREVLGQVGHAHPRGVGEGMGMGMDTAQCVCALMRQESEQG